MGWQDSPIVSTSAAQPKWMSSPIVQPSATAPASGPRAPIVMGDNPSVLGIAARTVGNDLWGAAGTAANAVANIPHAAVAAVDNLLQHAAGVEHPLPTHALEVTNTTPEMREFQQAVGQSPLVQNPVTQAVIGKMKQIAAEHPVAADLVSDAANLVPAAGAPREIGGALDALGAVSAGRKAAADAIENTPAQTPLEVARAADYKIRPSDVRAQNPTVTPPGLTRESLAEPTQLQREFTLHNQTRNTGLAAEDVGAPNKSTLTPADFNALKKAPMQVYADTGRAAGTFAPTPQYAADLDAIANRPGLEPDTREQIGRQVDAYRADQLSGPDAVKTLSVLRRRATLQMQSGKPEILDRGIANRGIANAIEDEIGRRLDALGETEQLGNFQAARTQLAKLHDVQSVTRAGQVDAMKLAKLQRRGVPFTGRLKIIADTAENFPNVMRHSTTATGTSGIPTATTVAGLARYAAGAIARKVPGIDVAGATFQNRLGPVARDIAGGARLGEYFGRTAPEATAPSPAPAPPGVAGDVPFTATRGSPGALSPQVAHAANTLAGDLQLAPEAPGHGLPFEPSDVRLGDLTASAVPPLHGDIPFTSSQPLGTAMAGNLKLAQPAAGGGIAFRPTTPNPRAAGTAGDLAVDEPPAGPQAPLALPAPTRGPIAVDQAGRAGASPAEVAAHRAALGLDELGPGVRQPATGPNPEREAAAASSLQAATTIRPPNQQAASKALRQLAKQVNGNPADDSKITLQYGTEIHPSVAQAFKAAGVDTTGFAQVIDADHVRHIFSEHGNAATELARGQVPVTPEDFAKLPTVMASPDSVEPSGLTGSGQPAVLIKKQIGNDVYVVQEARTGRKQLAITSMWKVGRRGQMPDLGAPAPDLNVRDVGDTTGSKFTTGAQVPAGSAGKSVPRSATTVLAQRSEPLSAHTVAHYADDTGMHIVRSRNGEASAQESGPYLRVERIDVNPASRGKGEATAMMERLLQAAQERGLTLGSDISVSPDQRKVYRVLSSRGWQVKQNPSSISPTTKNLVSDDIRVPVYEVRPPSRRR